MFGNTSGYATTSAAVNNSDFSLLATSFGSTTSDATYDPRFDYFGQGDNTAAYNNFVSLNYGNFWTGFTPTI